MSIALPEHRISTFGFEDLSVGQDASFTVTITEADLDRFASVSGDISPIHMDTAFARDRGFSGRVVHGAYLSGLVSRLIGVHLPGRNALLQTMNLRFRTPVPVGATVTVTGVVDQLSEAVRSGVILVTVGDTSNATVFATGKVGFGFT
jgi:3-hydroxybutyryl-CoA dehydratase